MKEDKIYFSQFFLWFTKHLTPERHFLLGVIFIIAEEIEHE